MSVLGPRRHFSPPHLDHLASRDRMPEPLVSIVVPAYNEARDIEDRAAPRRRGPVPPRDHRRRRRLRRRDRAIVEAAASGHHGVRLAAAATPTAARAPPSATGIAASDGRHRGHPGRRPRVRPRDLPTLLEPAPGGPRRRRLRHPPARRRAAARAPVLALRRQPLALAADQRPLQHDAQRHGGRLQGVPRRPDPLAPPGQRRLPLRARGHREGAAPQGIRLYEVPISYYGRTLDEGKKITWRDGVKAVGALLRFRFGRVSTMTSTVGDARRRRLRRQRAADPRPARGGPAPARREVRSGSRTLEPARARRSSRAEGRAPHRPEPATRRTASAADCAPQIDTRAPHGATDGHARPRARHAGAS